MSIPNPEYYGNPADYTNAYHILYRNPTAEQIALREQIGAEIPKNGDFGGNKDGKQGMLYRAVEQGKANSNTPIDISICRIGQAPEISPFNSVDIWQVFHNSPQGAPQITKMKTTNRGRATSIFFYSFQAETEFVDNRIRTQSGSDELLSIRWSPNGEFTNNNNEIINPNPCVYPFVSYGAKSMLLRIRVGIYINPSNPTLGLMWTTLNQWKTQYSNYTVSAIGFEIAMLKTITNGVRADYTTLSENDSGYAAYERVSAACYDAYDGVYYYTTNARDYTISNQPKSCIYILAPYVYDHSTGWVPSSWRIFLPTSGQFENETTSTYYSRRDYGGDRIYIYKQIPYSETNYNKIMAICASFGLPFTDKNIDNFATTFDSDDLYFPIIDDNGITHGEYTHGSANLTNPFNDLKDVREKDYKPDENVDPNTYSDTTNWNNVNFQQAFTKRYLLNASQVMDLATELWAAQSSKPADIDYHNFAIDEYLTNNPIDTIVSLKYFPCTFTDSIPSIVHLGKYTTNIAATGLATSVRIIDFAPIECFPHFNDFRDYEPYTELAMYVPFCGTVKIPTAECMGNYVSVKLAIDTSTGAATGYVIVSKSGSGGICVATCQGMAAIDIPVSGLQSANLANAVFNATANWTQTQVNNISANSGLFKHMGGTFGTIARGMSNSFSLSDVKGGVLGGPIGAVGTLVNSLNPISALQKGLNIDIDNAKADYELSHIQVPTRLVGSASPVLGCVIELDCRMIIYRPVTDETALSNYADTVGFATVQGGTVSQFSGFTVGTIDVSGINATAKEKQAIAAAFANGVYL